MIFFGSTLLRFRLVLGKAVTTLAVKAVVVRRVMSFMLRVVCVSVLQVKFSTLTTEGIERKPDTSVVVAIYDQPRGELSRTVDQRTFASFTENRESHFETKYLKFEEEKKSPEGKEKNMERNRETSSTFAFSDKS